MMSEIGSRLFRPGPAGGFTLVEILLVIALMGLLAGLCVAGTGMLLGTRPKRSVDIFWQTVTEARERAVTVDRIVTLAAVESGRVLILDAGEPSWRVALSGNDQLRILVPTVEANGFLESASKSANISQVNFYPDGTCDAFQAEIRSATGSPLTVAMDPWTCAPDVRPAISL